MKRKNSASGDRDTQSEFSVDPIGASIGATIRGLDLRQRLEPRTVDRIQEALLARQVLHFPNQILTPNRVLGIARRFGKPDIHPIWVGMADAPEIVRVLKRPGEEDPTSDRPSTSASHFECPSKIVVAYCDDERTNSDFLFSSLTAAMDGLSEKLKNFLRDLKAIHSGRDEFGPARRGAASFQGQTSSRLTYSDAIYRCTEHPVVHTHPDTGRESLYINEAYTQRITELTEAESASLLRFLFEHSAKPEYGCRFAAVPKSLIIWDNRVTTQRSTRYDLHQSRLLYFVSLSSEEALSRPQHWPTPSELPI